MLSIQLFSGVKDGEFGTMQQQQLVGEDEQGSYYHGETTTSHQKVALDEISFMQHHFKDNHFASIECHFDLFLGIPSSQHPLHWAARVFCVMKHMPNIIFHGMLQVAS